MKRYIPILIIVVALASCSTSTEITARPDPTAATSGTIGSMKASDGIVPLQQKVVPGSDSTHRR